MTIGARATRWFMVAAMLCSLLLALSATSMGWADPRQEQTRSHERRSWDDPAPSATLAHVTDVIQASWLHRRGVTGNGIGIALIDTGIVPVQGLDDATVLYGPDLSFDSQDPTLAYLDAYGHGTHLAGIIAAGAGAGDGGEDGDGADEGDDGENAAGEEGSGSLRGVAPDATLLSVKVGATDGAVDVSQVIAAIDWVVQHRDAPGLDIRVLVLAYGTDGVQDPATDPLGYAVEVAWRAGITVVVAAGNDGASSAQLVNPATNPHVITVTAADTRATANPTDDVLADFASTGGARMPDVAAPGVGVVSLRDPGSWLDETYPQARQGDAGFRGSGTSQAAAAAGAAAALLLQERPELTPDQVKALLVGTSRPLPGAAGPGMIDLRAASRAGAGLAPPRAPYGTGTGSLEAARGSLHVTDDGIELVGEQDIFGNPWDGVAWAAAALAGTSWQDGRWNGGDWTGTGWTSPPETWSGGSWSGRTWSGRSWSGRSWSGRSWSGRSWSGRSWSGRSWSGRSWSGRSWSGRSWSAGSWPGRSWSAETWE